MTPEQIQRAAELHLSQTEGFSEGILSMVISSPVIESMLGEAWDVVEEFFPKDLLGKKDAIEALTLHAKTQSVEAVFSAFELVFSVFDSFLTQELNQNSSPDDIHNILRTAISILNKQINTQEEAESLDKALSKTSGDGDRELDASEKFEHAIKLLQTDPKELFSAIEYALEEGAEDTIKEAIKSIITLNEGIENIPERTKEKIDPVFEVVDFLTSEFAGGYLTKDQAFDILQFAYDNRKSIGFDEGEIGGPVFQIRKLEKGGQKIFEDGLGLS